MLEQSQIVFKFRESGTFPRRLMRRAAAPPVGQVRKRLQVREDRRDWLTAMPLTHTATSAYPDDITDPDPDY